MPPSTSDSSGDDTSSGWESSSEESGSSGDAGVHSHFGERNYAFDFDQTITKKSKKKGKKKGKKKSKKKVKNKFKDKESKEPRCDKGRAPRKKVVDIIKRLQRQGAGVLVITCAAKRRHEKIKSFLRKAGIPMEDREIIHVGKDTHNGGYKKKFIKIRENNVCEYWEDQQKIIRYLTQKSKKTNTTLVVHDSKRD